MITKYRTVSYFGDPKIEKVDVLRETEKCVFLESRIRGERRENKISDCYCYFDTWVEAKNYIVSIAENKVKNAEAELQRAKDKLKKVIDCEEGQ